MNYYEILKVSKNASQQEIRDSYINLIKQYHPDVYTGSKAFAEKTTKELNDAYDVLSVEEKRREYDLSLNPPTMQYEVPKYQAYKTNTPPPESEMQPKETFEQAMKKNIHRIVDERVSKMSKKGKTTLIFLIIMIALFFTFLSINDYINLVTITQNRKERQREIQKQILDEKFRKSLEENEQNITSIENITI